MNKKKIILISVILLVIIISSIGIVLFSKEKNDKNQTTQKKIEEEEKENVIEEETTTSDEVESESTTEEPTTICTYIYKEDIVNIDDAYNYFESLGYELSVPVTEDEVRTIYGDYPSAISNEQFEKWIGIDVEFIMYDLACGTLPPNPELVVEEETIPEILSETYQETTPITAPDIVIDSYEEPTWMVSEPITQKIEEVDKTPEILNWIKENYGDRFVYNDLTYVYKPDEKKYYEYSSKLVHKMTSSTTSEMVTVYVGKSMYSINQMGVMLGCPSATEKNEWVMGIGGNFLYDENFNTVSYKENTLKFIKKPGCEEPISWWCNWDFMTAEGIPVNVYDEGYIIVEVLYPNSTENVNEKFTIEEYYEFLNKYEGKYYIEEERGQRWWQGDEPEDYVDKWVEIRS